MTIKGNYCTVAKPIHLEDLCQAFKRLGIKPAALQSQQNNNLFFTSAQDQQTFTDSVVPRSMR